MPITYVSGDPLLTQAQVLAIGHNAKGRTETTPLHTKLMHAYPPAFSMYERNARKGSIRAGTYWLWRDTQPMLMFIAVRDAPVGATRLRYVQSAIINLARDHQRERLHSVAMAPLGTSQEWPDIKPILEQWITPSKLHIVVYDTVQTGIKAEENL